MYCTDIIFPKGNLPIKKKKIHVNNKLQNV